MSERRTSALGLPTPMSQSDDIRGGEIAAALWRWCREWRRYKRIDARADAEPDGPRKKLLDDLVEHVLCPAESAAEDALIASIFKLCPPQRDVGHRRYRGVSIARVGGTLIVVTTNLDDDGAPMKGDTEAYIVPLDAAIRVKPDRNISFDDPPLRSPIRGPFPIGQQFVLVHPEMGLLMLDVWAGTAADWGEVQSRGRWVAKEREGLVIAVKGVVQPTTPEDPPTTEPGWKCGLIDDAPAEPESTAIIPAG